MAAGLGVGVRGQLGRLGARLLHDLRRIALGICEQVGGVLLGRVEQLRHLLAHPLDVAPRKRAHRLGLDLIGLVDPRQELGHEGVDRIAVIAAPASLGEAA